jgi:hypothetical protein
MATKNEFLRSRPAQRTRNVLFDLSNLVIPIFVVVTGFILFAQTFAKLVRYNPVYTDTPVWVTKESFLFIKTGYPFYNPGSIALNIMSRPFDKTINAVLFPSLFPLLVCVGIAVILFFVVSAIRGYGFNRNDNLYGSARWGTVRDLRKFGLTKMTGIVIAQFQKADLLAKINPKNASLSLFLKK